nr:MAG TPA: Smc4, Condensin complex subunit 2, SMC complex, ATPase, chromosome [Microviridae sp.]
MKDCFQIRPTDESGEKWMITIGNHLANEKGI